ncbi:exopolygalacturonase-like [Macadamia integrifolia]|uniref:exopolygalacturonase-like n=1 Tax=Macadamia integrifolia TaxID=60698 RepID=UPI001C4F73E6|nr:exopolygalacturonase-like [Macadamia integrifolia]
MAVVLLSCLVALLSFVADGAPVGTAIAARGRGHPVPSDVKVFNVLNFGAKPGGKFDCTEAFMKAWNAACHWRGKARLVIPMGTFLTSQTIFQGPCAGPPPITVQVAGTVKADTDVSDFETPEWFSFDHINGLILTGGGTFDGQGAAVWKFNDCSHNSDCQLMPANIKFNHVSNARIRRIHSLNSKAFHILMSFCQNIGARRLSIIAPGDSPNTDGIHISESNSVTISKSMIGTGDDCISIGQGATNITIDGLSCGPGHGISVGSLGKYPDEKDVNKVTVTNCTLTNTQNGVRIKTWPGSPPSHATGFIFQDLIMNNVKNPIIIDQQYCSGSKCSNKPPSRVQVSDVHFRDIRGTSATKVAVNIACSQQFPCQNVELHNINLKYKGPTSSNLPATSSCANAKLGFSGIQNPPPCR